MRKNILVSPVVKWVGGKRQLLSEIEPFIPENISTYVEPFIGGAALLFHLQPKKAVINDYNSELMNVYNVIKEQPDELITALEKHHANNSEEYYYEIRVLDRKEGYDTLSNVDKAARILYLNKTGYNGLFRVNQAGQFNVPYGKYKNPAIVNDVTIKAVSKYFNSSNIKFLTGDYKQALKGLKKVHSFFLIHHICRFLVRLLLQDIRSLVLAMISKISCKEKASCKIISPIKKSAIKNLIV